MYRKTILYSVRSSALDVHGICTRFAAIRRTTVPASKRDTHRSRIAGSQCPTADDTLAAAEVCGSSNRYGGMRRDATVHRWCGAIP